MDYTGFGKDGRHRYEIDRSLTDDEKNNRLDLRQKASDAPLDWLSVIKLNNTYLELVDRWYPIKGTSAWQGGRYLYLEW